MINRHVVIMVGLTEVTTDTTDCNNRPVAVTARVRGVGSARLS